ncbi:unnamed protein product [Rotaria socialis]|uniref:Uncharacterized protein n=1 Tax=Rotaria socialis TaxID=392032 RepID=A0A821SMK4_9BILA|nr:unnamed protein product [Rotaria socialis]
MEQRRVYGTQNQSTSNTATGSEPKRKMTLQSGWSDGCYPYSYGTPIPSTSNVAAGGDRKRKMAQAVDEQSIKTRRMSRSSTPVRADTTVDLITLEMDSPNKYDPTVCRAVADVDSTIPFVASDDNVVGDCETRQTDGSDTLSPDRKPMDS